MLQEVALWCNTKTSDRQGERNLPVSRFAHHLSRLGINEFDCFGPLWMVGFGLCSLGVVVNKYAIDNNPKYTPSQSDAASESTFLQMLSSNGDHVRGRTIWIMTPGTLRLPQRLLAAKPVDL